MGGTGIHNPADLTEVLANIAANNVLLAVIQATTADTNADLEVVDANVDAIRAITDAEAILEETGGELTTDGTLQTIYVNNAPAGVWAPRWFGMDFANQTVTETVRIIVSYREAPAGPWVVDDRETIVGIPVSAGIWVQLKENRYGLLITVEKTVGTNRAYDWTILYEV